jgi:hypothetical protein
VRMGSLYHSIRTMLMMVVVVFPLPRLYRQNRKK